MDVSEITTNALQKALNEIELYEEHGVPMRLDRVLPIATLLIKSKMEDIEMQNAKQKFCVPSWIGILMGKLNNCERLSDIDYVTFQHFVANLKPEDYKLCADNILGYEVRYLTSNEIMETISALKKYFNVR